MGFVLYPITDVNNLLLFTRWKKLKCTMCAEITDPRVIFKCDNTPKNLRFSCMPFARGELGKQE